MEASSTCHHMERTHRTVLPQTRDVDIVGGGLATYRVSFMRLLKFVVCLVDG